MSRRSGSYIVKALLLATHKSASCSQRHRLVHAVESLHGYSYQYSIPMYRIDVVDARTGS